jgi:glycosyltransferase involved in cell wall biosynthesis
MTPLDVAPRPLPARVPGIGHGGRPRVLLACDWFVRYTAGLASGLAERGCSVTLITRDHTLEFPGEAPEDQVAYIRSYVANVLGPDARHLALRGRVRDPRALPGFVRLARAASRLGPALVHVQDSVVNDPRLPAAAGVRPGRYAVTVHDPTPHPGDPAPTRRQRLTRRVLLGNAGLLLVHSEALRAELLAIHGDVVPIEVVPHGTDGGRALPLAAAPRLLFFGRMSRYKGLEVLLDAMPLVWRTVPEATLEIAGDGPLPDSAVLADARVLVSNHHVPEDAIPGLFEGARAVVLPYTQASQSGVGSQAKAFGRPLVTSDAGGLPELVADGSGVVVPAGDVEALAGALVDVLAGSGVAERMAARAAEGAARTDWAQVADLALEAYRRHLPAPDGGAR